MGQCGFGNSNSNEQSDQQTSFAPKGYKVLKQFKIEQAAANSIEELKLDKNGQLDLQTLKEFIQQIQNFSYLKKLALDASKNKYQEGYATELFTGLSQLNELVELDLNLSNGHFVQQECMKLKEGLEKISQLGLNSFSFNLKNSLEQNQTSLILDGLFNLKQLNYLSLNLSGNNFTSNDLSKFGEIIAQFSELKSLELILNNCSLDSKGIQNFGNQLHKSVSIEDLVLDFNQNQEIGDNGITSFSQDLKKLEKLQSLKLYFNSININNAGSISIAQSVKHLTHLTLEFGKNIDEKGAIEISKALSDAQNMIYLNLNTNYSEIQDEGFISLSKIGQIQTLETLILTIKANSISDKGLSEFSSRFNWTSQSLKSFSLELQGSPQFQDVGIISLGDNISKSLTIESFTLSMIGSSIRLDGVSKFSKSLIKMKQLKTIDFGFAYCEYGKQGAIELISNLSKLENLQNATIGIQKSKLLNEGLFEIASLLEKYPQLTNLRLLVGHNQLDGETIPCLLNALANMLKAPKIYFEYGYNIIEEQFKQQIKEAAEGLKLDTDIPL